MLILDQTGLASFALLCALIHECGHILALRIMKLPVDEVSFKLFGINISLKSGRTLSYGQEIALALSGSAANLFTCIPTYLLYAAGVFQSKTGAVFAFSLLLGGFNLLPIGSLDGGRALGAMLCQKISCTAAAKTVNALSIALLVPIVIAGVFIVKKTGYNLSLVIVSVYLAASLVFKVGFTHRINKSE